MDLLSMNDPRDGDLPPGYPFQPLKCWKTYVPSKLYRSGPTADGVIGPDGNGYVCTFDNRDAAWTPSHWMLLAFHPVPIPFASLPTSPTAAQRCVINDSTLVYSGANIGSAAAGGSTHTAPVIYLGSWVIG
jgi:hypothetical protein